LHNDQSMHQLIHQRSDDFMEKSGRFPRNQIHNFVESVEIMGQRSDGDQRKRNDSHTELAVAGGQKLGINDFFFNSWGGTLGTAATSGLLYQPQMICDGDCGEIGGIKIGRGNRSTRRKPVQAPLCLPQISHA
jgi:hypothetical protein